MAKQVDIKPVEKAPQVDPKEKVDKVVEGAPSQGMSGFLRFNLGEKASNEQLEYFDKLFPGYEAFCNATSVILIKQ